MKLLLVLGLAIILLMSIGHTEDLAVYAGYTLFPNPAYDSVVLVEFPFSINRSELSFFQGDTTLPGYVSRVFAQVDIFGVDALPYDSVRTYFSVPLDDLKKARDKKQRIFNSLKILLPPGIYSARLTVIDVHSKAKGEFFINDIAITPPVKNQVALGGFTTAYVVQYLGSLEPKRQTVFYKNGYHVIMNPLDLYTVDDSLLSLYGEVYNLQFDPEHPSKYMIAVNALHQNHDLYTMFGSRVRTKAGPTAVFTEQLDISDWPKGHYFLQVIATDLVTETSDTLLEPVHIISENEVMLAMAEQQARLAELPANWADPYDSLTLTEKQQLVKYLLTDEQERVLNSLNDQGKVAFLQQYWKEHDDNPATGVNENRVEMIKRYRYANQYFSTNDVKNNGWLSDRGRILMTYGMWDDRDDVEAPRIGNPFEIWYYNRLGQGYIFVFDDWSGSDDYRLIHSNVDGERFNAEWEERLKSDFMQILE